MTTIKQFIGAIRALVTSPRALAVLAVLYLLLLATLLGFSSIPEATLWQVTVTYLFLILIPLEFFVLQAAILQHTRTQKFPWAQIVRDAIKLAVVTIPIVLLGFGIAYLLNKWQVRYPTPEPVLAVPASRTPTPPPPLHWPTVLFATARLLIFGILLPLATIHLWIEVSARAVRDSLSGGAGAVLQRIGIALARAFQFDSVLTYALGLIIFFLIPYFILWPRIPVKGNKTDFAAFIAQVVLAALFTLIGWVVTVATLAKIETPPPAPVSKVSEAQVEAAA